MAPHSSTLAWKIPWTEEPGGLQSMRSPRVGHERATSLSLFTFMHWRRKWQPTPVFLPEGSQGQGSLVGCRLWGRTESDTTAVTQQQQQQCMYVYTMHKCAFQQCFWPYSTFQAHLVYFLLQPRISEFSKEPWPKVILKFLGKTALPPFLTHKLLLLK